MNIRETIKLKDELDRENFYELYISKQTNINSLNGIIIRKDIPKIERLYYYDLILNKMKELTQSKGLKK